MNEKKIVNQIPKRIMKSQYHQIRIDFFFFEGTDLVITYMTNKIIKLILSHLKKGN